MRYAYELIANSDSNLIISGRAGTGKTTFIRNVLETVDKSFVILAPTGIAALNASGKTLHSFFGFPLSVMGPNDYGRMPSRNQKCLFGGYECREADAIIIDEVSMVRCDLMDGIDRMLRRGFHSTAPFGGKQMIFIGDLYQLSPVVTDEERPLLEELYGGSDYHFFSARCINADSIPKIEFEKVYRQEDKRFINILENIRVGDVRKDDLSVINSRVQEAGYQNDDTLSINLTSFRNDADKYNDYRLSLLPGPSRIYKAIYEGDCREYHDAIDDVITLKVGAQVVFTKNDGAGLWANGTIGIVSGLADEYLEVVLETGELVMVERAKWDITDTYYDRSLQRTVLEVRGVISQFPIKVAWAITIHKSQSMTYSHACIDFGRGAFCEGQAYVALSRLKSLEGLTLVGPLKQSSIIISEVVIHFMKDVNDYSCYEMELSLSGLLKPALCRHKYDEVAKLLYAYAVKCSKEGDTVKSYELLCRYYECVIDDGCITSSAISIPPEKKNAPFLNACFKFYDGDAQKALSIIDEKETATDEFIVAYLRLKCFESLAKWDEFDDALSDLLFMCNMDIETNVPTIHHRKVLWEALKHWRRLPLKVGATAMKTLLDDVMEYEKLYVQLHHIAMSCLDFQDVLAERGGVIGSILTNMGLSDQDVCNAIKALGNPRNENNRAWQDFLVAIMVFANTI